MKDRIKKIGVVGAGQMGSGIAHVAALAGIDVVLFDVSAERVKSSLATINGNMARQVAGGKVGEAERKAALARIVPTTDMDAFADADLVIESATENEATKRQIFTEVSAVLKPGAML